MTLIAANDESPLGSSASVVTFQAQAGTTYRIAVDGSKGAFGNFALNLKQGVFLQPLSFANQQASFVLHGIAGRKYIFQASSDLGTWTPISTNLLRTDRLMLMDTNMTQHARRFYRAVGAQ